MMKKKSFVYQVAMRSVRNYTVDVLAPTERDARERAVGMADTFFCGDTTRDATDEVLDVLELGEVEYPYPPEEED